MSTDYRRQYPPDQLEPMWPDAAIRGIVSTLCLLAVLVVVAVLPVVLDRAGMGDWLRHSEPADPHATPTHIRPEWYFLAAYQLLKLFPNEFLGMSGRTMGVLSQTLFVFLVILLPFLWRRGMDRPPSVAYGTIVTVLIWLLIAFTMWGEWPPRPLLVATFAAASVLFYALVLSERIGIRRARRRKRDQAP